MTTPKPVVLCILDGWGLREETANNAPALADTPNFDRLMATCPNSTLITHGPDVGLPTGQMGNSEVGHTNIGAGRVVAMDLGQIDLAIEDGSFFENDALQTFIADMKASGGVAHLAGLTSPGGVHSHQDHIVAAAKAITDAGVPVAIHVITDGRDVPPTSAWDQVSRFDLALPDGARIVSVSGRYFAMDRDNRWERVAKAYGAIVRGDGDAMADPVEGIALCYDFGQQDEFIEPFVAEGYKGMKDGDGLFFINFRADRAREILRAIGEPGFDAFQTGARPKLAAVLGMVEYSDAHNAYMTTCFPKRNIVNTLAEWVAKHDLRQFHLAETEKYPHVTFFLNGGKEAPEEGEDRYMAASPKVATYDLQPEMSAPEVTEHFVGAIRDGYDLIVTNYANPDMVGHTGDLQAAMAACAAVDEGLGQVLAALEDAGGAMIVTADHGNCETMWDETTNGPHTAHTTNLVPVVMFGGPNGATLSHGRLADLAPTLLELMGLEQPPEMTGISLIRR
ncbi:2,3-bisphosphoglycerate-independent phosphoglycerate mutase [Aliiroseovarius subalbicans]|uniref:2,3-bisphosphoglycerate-independent phosphoglycerate mutase n=1 Tax=Aliiroseovarius subalbicans TaxID=2925840 RepID=UPI001F573140|nr:2,3-bisphosphoglycerate-independent phosphoglycerate mutase [Aliiroseovarius subalbicans]MCI2399900.1 2,3-bisphosphoglycerate-independent phosphoglycerate mutase [Aliiroseovarius subalbicans]